MTTKWIALNTNCPEVNKIFDTAEEAMAYTHPNGNPNVVWEITGFENDWGTGWVYVLVAWPNRKPEWVLNKQTFISYQDHCNAKKAILALQKNVKLT